MKKLMKFLSITFMLTIIMVSNNNFLVHAHEDKLSTSVENSIISPQALVCCDNMSLYTTQTTQYGGETVCQEHSMCTKYYTDNYSVKKCRNCSAVHSKTYLNSKIQHVSYK